jgi:ABC-type nitrate/sulfonate/bicarbonate transport system substrate-binding protein
MRISKYLTVLFSFLIVTTIATLIYVSWNKDDDYNLIGKTKIKLQLQWFDQAQFIGFYVACEKKYYSDEGLEVEIIQGGFNINPILKVRTGEADIGLITADQLLLQRAEGHEIKAIGNVFNKSIACFMSRKDLNIQNPQDLVGKKVGIYRGFDTENILYSILKKHNIDEKQLNIVDAGNFSAFIAQEIDAFPSYLINEPILAEDNNIKVNILYPDDFGVQFYSDTLFTTEKFLNTNRKTVERFLRASAKGWDYAKNHPDDALSIMFNMIRTQNPKSEYQKQMLMKVIENIYGGPKNSMFYMDRSRWDNMEQCLYTIGKLKTQGHVGELCDFKMANEGK